MTYTDQLKHPMWQKRRLEIMELHDFECGNCGNTENMLNIHHKIYKKGHKAWEYLDEEYECLCTDCHSSAHHLNDIIKEILSKLTFLEKERVLGYALALGDPVDFKGQCSPETIEGLSDFYRISKLKLARFIIDSDKVNLFDIFEFAKQFYPSQDDFIRRGF